MSRYASGSSATASADWVVWIRSCSGLVSTSRPAASAAASRSLPASASASAPDAHAALMERSEALLRAIGWEGPAMVEYRYDEATGAAVLMEINGRLWGSLPLAGHAGAEFALGTYYALGLGRAPPAAAPAG